MRHNINDKKNQKLKGMYFVESIFCSSVYMSFESD